MSKLSCVARSDTMRTLFNVKTAKGTPVRDHCMNIISMLIVLEALSAEIDGENHLDMILQSCLNHSTSLALMCLWEERTRLCLY
jgi:hypothetical protein